MSYSSNQFTYFLNSSHDCKKFLHKDGITSAYFELNTEPGFFSKTKYDINSLKNTFQQIGESMSILKNLDYYQYLMCTMLPDIADSNPYKKEFQKVRFMIICSFTKFISFLNIGDYETIKKWNILSKIILELVAEIVNGYRQGVKFGEISKCYKVNNEFCIFFNLDIEKMDEELTYHYL